MKGKSITGLKRLETGVRNLDALLHGGLPEGSLSVLAGAPGVGKTTLAEQIAFHQATPEHPVIFFQTLSEPTVKHLRYIQQFSFFSQEKLDSSARFIDLGGIMRSKGLEKATEMVMEHVRKIRPGIVIIDSFKVFSELADSKEELRKFTYKVLIDLLAWECTTFLLGEFTDDDIAGNPLFSIVDGIFLLSAVESSGEQQRFIQITKMRGTDHDRDRHPLVITRNGIDVYAPRVTIERNIQADAQDGASSFRMTGIESFDALLGNGILSGASVLISGPAGTGKTLLALEVLYRGASRLNEKGIFFSFEQSAEQLKAAARAVDMDLEREIKRGLIEVVAIPQSGILVERDLQMMDEEIRRFGAQRVAIDSLSAFFHKIKDAQIARDKIVQLVTLVQRARAIGFFTTAVPYRSYQLSSFGVEESVVDGIVVLSTAEEGRSRKQYLEVYKLRTADHARGRREMTIGSQGIRIAGNSTE